MHIQHYATRRKGTSHERCTATVPLRRTLPTAGAARVRARRPRSPGWRMAPMQVSSNNVGSGFSRSNSNSNSTQPSVSSFGSLVKRVMTTTSSARAASFNNSSKNYSAPNSNNSYQNSTPNRSSSSPSYSAPASSGSGSSGSSSGGGGFIGGGRSKGGGGK